MKCLNNLEDDQFPKQEITHTRQTARAVLINKNNQVCLVHLYGDDLFGHRDYYETPGGGIENGETPEEAVLREIKEETGYKAEIISEIGYVSDFYNLIQRHNINNYYLLLATEQGEAQLLPYEKTIIESIGWYTFEEALKLYENMSHTSIEKLVRARELPVLKEALNILQRMKTE